MFNDNFDDETSAKNFRCSLYSILFHGSLLAATVMAPSSQLIPEGTTPLSVEFTAIAPAPKGFQDQTLNIAKQEQVPTVKAQPESAPQTLPTPEKPTPKANEALKSKDVVIAKTPEKAAPQKIKSENVKPKEVKQQKVSEIKKPQPKEKKVVKKTSPKAIANAAPVDDAALAESELFEEAADEFSEALPVATKTATAKKPIDDIEAKGFAAEEEKVFAGDPNSATPIHRPSTEPSIDEPPTEQKTAETTPAVTTAPQANTLANTVANNKPEVAPSNQKPIKNQPAQGTPNQGAQQQRTANTNYGVPSGTRDFRDLRQYPGNRPPQYPLESRYQKETGQTVLFYYVTKTGLVQDIKVMKSSGYARLDQSALDAVKRYRYFPGQEGYTTHPIRFDLSGKAIPSGGRLRTSSLNP